MKIVLGKDEDGENPSIEEIRPKHKLKSKANRKKYTSYGELEEDNEDGYKPKSKSKGKDKF